MKKGKLDIEIGEFYSIVGIFSTSELYKIIGKINKELAYELYNQEEKPISLHRKKDKSNHTLYHFCKKEQETCLSIIENNGSAGLLLTKSPKPVLIAVFCGSNANNWAEDFVKQMKMVNFIDAFELPLQNMAAHLHEFINHD